MWPLRAYHHPEKDWVKELSRYLTHPDIKESKSLKEELKRVRHKIRKQGNKLWNEIVKREGMA